MTDADSPSSATDLDAIDAALGRLRGRGSRPGGAGGHRGAPHGFGPRGHWPAPPEGGPAMRMGGGPARLRLIEALHAASHPLSVSELGEAIGVDQPRASRLVQQSVEMGLAQREADPDDARRTRIALTPVGEQFARGFRGRRREHLTAALTDFSADERAELARLLTKLAAAWPRD
ncbi:MarR family winged helix-turn-helix transcriptional regulator [Microbacterium hominis]|uniref:MarR family winged helix-turn-helix transcriptional regulator n=1 Tax=Microbacterium hominis TaxID=162426 RepID=UPI0009DEDD67|nr:MarR family winged helix-turn-helix transcriptional regulator [Microbacterium hominis]